MKTRNRLSATVAGMVLTLGTASHAQASASSLAFVGTQGSTPEEGIVAVRLDPRSGALKSLGVVAHVERPTWVKTDRAHHRLFSVSEVGNDGKSNGAVLAFVYDPASGRVRPLGRADAGGGGSTHLALARDGRTVFVANYGTGQVAAIPVGADGRLAGRPVSVAAHQGTGPSPRQKGPHAHGVTLDPSGKWLLSPDLGADKVYVYRLGQGAGTLQPAPAPFVTLPAGSGPRHIVFTPDGRYAFLMTEMGATIFAYSWDSATGRLTRVSETALDGPDGTATHSGSEIAISRNGRFLYAGNRAANRLQVYAIAGDAKLSLLQSLDCGGQVPWSFSLDGSGRWLVVANQVSNSLAVFAVDPKAGKLAGTDKRLDIAKPTSIAFTDR